MERAGGGERWRPPRGRHRLPPEVVARSQRERLLDAAIRVVAEKGYAAATIGDLTGEAGVSRTTFYELFEDKEACFLAAYDGAVELLVRRVTSAYESEERWPERAAAGLAALLEALAEEPQLARLALVDVGAAGTGRAAPLPRRGAAADAALRRGARLRPRRARPAREHLANGDRRRHRADRRRADRRPRRGAPWFAFRRPFCHAGAIYRPGCGCQGGREADSINVHVQLPL